MLSLCLHYYVESSQFQFTASIQTEYAFLSSQDTLLLTFLYTDFLYLRLIHHRSCSCAGSTGLNVMCAQPKVKAGLKGVDRLCIDNNTRKAIPCTDNSHGFFLVFGWQHISSSSSSHLYVSPCCLLHFNKQFIQDRYWRGIA